MVVMTHSHYIYIFCVYSLWCMKAFLTTNNDDILQYISFPIYLICYLNRQMAVWENITKTPDCFYPCFQLLIILKKRTRFTERSFEMEMSDLASWHLHCESSSSLISVCSPFYTFLSSYPLPHVSFDISHQKANPSLSSSAEKTFGQPVQCISLE